MSTELATFHEPTRLEKFVENYSRDFGDEPFKADRVKIPGAGGTTWEIPGDNPDETEDTKTLEGVWIYGHHASRLYLESFDERDAGAPSIPDAYSIDGKTQVVTEAGRQKALAKGLPVPSTNLLECPYSQWDSAQLLGRKGAGKAASDYYVMYILRGNSFLPIQVDISAMSIKEVTEFKRRSIAGRGYSLTDVVISLALKKEKNKAGIDYAKVVPSVKEVLPPAQAALYGQYAEQLIPGLQTDPWARSVQGHDEEFVEVEPTHGDDPFGSQQELGDLLEGVEIT